MREGCCMSTCGRWERGGDLHQMLLTWARGQCSSQAHQAGVAALQVETRAKVQVPKSLGQCDSNNHQTRVSKLQAGKSFVMQVRKLKRGLACLELLEAVGQRSSRDR